MAAGVLAAMTCALRLASGAVTTYDAGVTATAGARTDVTIPGVLEDVELEPRLGLGWMDGRDELGAQYGPRLALESYDSTVQVLHRASLTGARQLTGRWRGTASLGGSYGTNDLLLPGALPAVGGTTAPGQTGTTQPGQTGTTQPGQTTPSTGTAATLQPLPSVTRLKYLSGEADLGLAGTPAPRCRLLASLSAFTSGGADPVARQSLPLQRGLSLGGTLEWTARPADVLASSVGATVTFFEPTLAGGFLQATETWRHNLSEHAQLELGAGPAITAHRPAGGPTSWAFGPAGAIGITDQWFGTLNVGAALSATPVVDQVSGAVYDRADASASVGWRIVPGLTTAVLGTAGVVMQGAQEGDKIAAGDVHIAWTPSLHWDLSAGAHALLQQTHATGPNAVSAEGVYVAVGVHDHGNL